MKKSRKSEAACVQIRQVTKRFGEDLVLKEVNLTLNCGQVYGIVGNNGSGKTVLMKCSAVSSPPPQEPSMCSENRSAGT